MCAFFLFLFLFVVIMVLRRCKEAHAGECVNACFFACPFFGIGMVMLQFWFKIFVYVTESMCLRVQASAAAAGWEQNLLLLLVVRPTKVGASPPPSFLPDAGLLCMQMFRLVYHMMLSRVLSLCIYFFSIVPTLRGLSTNCSCYNSLFIYLSVYICVCLSVSVCVCLSVGRSVCRCFVHLFVCLFNYLFACLFICLFICLVVYLFIFIYLFILYVC